MLISVGSKDSYLCIQEARGSAHEKGDLVGVNQIIIIFCDQNEHCMSQSPQLDCKMVPDSSTEDSQMKAPRPRPMESAQMPPQLVLEEESLALEFQEKLTMGECESPVVLRRRSLDMSYSIIGFITRKIREKSRQRIMSEEINMLH